MELIQNSNSDKVERAKKCVECLKAFYVHLAVYLIVNTFISINKIVRNLNNGENFQEAFWDFGTFAVWVFWGIGVAYQASKVFGYNPFFGKQWEERKIKELMNEDEQNRWN